MRFTFSNSFDYKIFSELFDQNVSTASFFFKASNSLTNDDIKLSERLFVPTSKLRGFEKGKLDLKMEKILLVEIMLLQ